MAQGKPRTLDAALAQLPRTFGVRCKTCQLPPDREAEVRQHASEGEDAKRIAAGLRLMGYAVSHDSVQRHLRGDCATRKAATC